MLRTKMFFLENSIVFTWKIRVFVNTGNGRQMALCESSHRVTDLQVSVECGDSKKLFISICIKNRWHWKRTTEGSVWILTRSDQSPNQVSVESGDSKLFTIAFSARRTMLRCDVAGWIGICARRRVFYGRRTPQSVSREHGACNRRRPI